jgi:hypothetical protein
VPRAASSTPLALPLDGDVALDEDDDEETAAAAAAGSESSANERREASAAELPESDKLRGRAAPVRNGGGRLPRRLRGV